MPHSTIWEAFLSSPHRSVSTDTRKIKPGDLFFALKGDHFDGNEFAAKALEAGAAYVVVDQPSAAVTHDDRYFLVPNALAALQTLGRRYRESFSIPVIAITGSNGKTTTKELVHAVLSSELRAYATQGNLNNHIGVPLTLLAMPTETEIAVIEMGANKPRDIEELVNIALPSHGIITNIGQAHLEGMGGMEGVQRTKGELFDYLRTHGGVAFVNEHDPRVAAVAYGIQQCVGYGGPGSGYRILARKEVGDGQVLKLMVAGRPLEVQLNLLGQHNAENALVAATVGHHFHVSDAGIQAALAGYRPRMHRSQLIHQAHRTILLDAYNANPSSMQATIDSIAQQHPASVALILGDMFELGTSADTLHAHIWEYARQAIPEALLVGIGPIFHRLRPSNALARSYASVEDAQAHLGDDLKGYSFVLLKGSRGMALERLLPALGVDL